LLGTAEVAVPGGLPRCIRILLHFYTSQTAARAKHMYLQTLRAPAGSMTDVKVTAKG
jgi:chorismate mutase